jgi:hypothetical protein
MVKRKSRNLQIFTGYAPTIRIWLLPTISLLTFIASCFALYPSRLVERWYAKTLFPRISRLFGPFADAIPLAWLDLWIPLALVLVILLIWKRRWAWLLNIVAALYLIFFWSWGLNYHRPPLASKLSLDDSRMQGDAMDAFAKRAASELNRLYDSKERENYDEDRTREEARRRVERVVKIVDGTDWPSARRIKFSRLGGPWLRAAGVDGIFNPLAHEPIITDSLLDIERPFVMAHELAHVRGYPEEGDANVIAAFATLMSNDPAFQYSGWLNLWLYLRTPELDALLDPGPRNDVRRVFERARAEQVRWVSDFQRSLLDLFLKVNSVKEGVRSYSRVVLLVAGTEGTWAHYR